MENAKLLFEDNFTGDVLDPAKWARCPEWPRHGKSYWKDALAYVDGEGHLVLGMEWDESTQLINCGAVWTKGLFAHGYGYYEASIRFTPHRGAWGAFWLMMGDLNRPTSAEGLEIDVVESIGNENHLYQSVLHWNYPDLHSIPFQRDGQADGIIDVYDGEFHTFGVLRAEEGYTFYVDGTPAGHATAEQCAPCPLDGYMLLSCEAAEWSGAGTPESIAQMPAQMVVDYVRVYDRLPDGMRA
jgi:beta-glucanase (GH16 family)